MIISSTSLSDRSAQPTVRPVSVDVPKVVITTPGNEPKPSPEKLSKAVSTINMAMQQANHGLEFSLDPTTDEPIVKIVDTTIGEVLRQIPSEETLAIARAIDRFQQGLLLREKA